MELAKELTAAQIWAALATVAALLGWSNALYKNVFGKNLGESIRSSVMRRWFRRAIFEKDVMTKLENFQLLLNKAVSELNYNGGSTTKDVTRQTQLAVEELTGTVKNMMHMVSHNIARRNISDRHSDNMIFRLDARGACFFINEKFLRDFGWTESDILAFKYEQIIAEEDLPEVRLKLNDSINRKSTFISEHSIKERDGVFYRCHFIADPIIIDEELVEFYGLIHIMEQ